MSFDNFITQLLNGTDFVPLPPITHVVNGSMFKCYTAKKILGNDELVLRIEFDETSTIIDNSRLLSPTNICLFGDIVCNEEDIDKTVVYYLKNTVNQHDVDTLIDSLCAAYNSDAWHEADYDDWHHGH